MYSLAHKKRYTSYLLVTTLSQRDIQCCNREGIVSLLKLYKKDNLKKPIFMLKYTITLKFPMLIPKCDSTHRFYTQFLNKGYFLKGY